MNAPLPPPAFWVTVPWWAGMAFLILAFVALPFAIQFLRGKTSGYRTREEAALAGQAALDKQRDQFVVALQTDRDAARADLSRERAERRAEQIKWREDRRKLDANRIEGWNRGRGMEVQAHRIWHDLKNAVLWGNSVLLLLQRLVAGSLRPETVAELMKEHEPLKMPGPVPRLQEVDPKAPHETQYG